MEQLDYVELAKQFNPWIAALAALLGVVIAGILNLITQLFVGWRKRCLEAKTLRLALISEINGIVSVIEARRYREGLNSASDEMTKNQTSTWPFSVKMPENHCPIYQANLDKIGLLKPAEASFIVGFHQVILSVIQDVTPGGVLYNGGTAEQFGEAAALLDHAVDMGNMLSNHVKIPTSLDS